MLTAGSNVITLVLTVVGHRGYVPSRVSLLRSHRVRPRELHRESGLQRPSVQVGGATRGGATRGLATRGVATRGLATRGLATDQTIDASQQSL